MHPLECQPGEIRPAASRYDHRRPRLLGRRDEGRRGTGAGPEESDRKMPRLLVPRDEPHRRHQPIGKQADVEDVGPVDFLLRREQVEQKCADPCFMEYRRDEYVPRTEAARAAAVREKNEADARFGQRETPRQSDRRSVEIRGGNGDIEGRSRILCSSASSRTASSIGMSSKEVWA
jgi:hypothetical protein